MAETNDFSDSEQGQAATALQSAMTTDPVIRTALLARRMRALAGELRDIPGPKRDLIIKMWSRGATPAEIACVVGLPGARVDHVLGLRGSGPAPSRTGGASNGVEG